MEESFVLDTIFEKGLYSFLSLAGVTIVVCWIVSRVLISDLKRRAKKNKNKADTIFISNTVRFLVWTIGLLIVLGQIKPLKPLGDTLLGASGIFAVGFSIAAQTTMSNYIAGFFLAIHQPFKTGDEIYLKEKGISGIVREITFRHTCIETEQGTLITIPNTTMNTTMVEDLSHSLYTKDLEFRVARGTDLDKLKIAVNDVIAENELSAVRYANVAIDAFDASSYKICVPLSAETKKKYVELKNSIVPRLLEELKNRGVDIL